MDFREKIIKEKLGDIVRIEQALNVKKYSDGHNGSHYYHKMDKDFLEDMELMTGEEKSFEVAEGKEIIWLNGREMIHRIAVLFDRWTGKYDGLYMVIFQRRKNGSPKLSTKEIKTLRTKEVNQIILGFVAKANRLGYLTDV